MRVLVTGVTGFVGSAVARALLVRGHEVHALVRTGADRWRIRDIEAALHVVEGDLAVKEQWIEPLLGLRLDGCLHLAWYAEPGKYAHHAGHNVACLGQTLELLLLAEKARWQVFVGAGTCMEYDLSGSAKLDESAPVQPATIYGTAKLAAFMLGTRLASQLDVRFSWGRLFYLHGRYEDERRVIPSFVRAATRGERFSATPGDQVRDYLHVNDAAAAFVTLLESRASGAFNVCSGQPVTVADLLARVARLMRAEHLLSLGSVPQRSDEPMHVLGDNSRLVALGWTPVMDLEGGLADTVTWHAAHRGGRRP
jgi:dTDP-6-deoxy-L-talose 4-dehydrogenase (NAD+)